MKKEMFAVKIRNEKEVERVSLGNVIIIDNRISGNKLDELHRKAYKFLHKSKGEYIKIVTDDGYEPVFKGYPASHYNDVIVLEKGVIK